MNEEQLRTKINELIKTQTLQEYLLNCLKNECELNNFLNLNSSLIYNAWQRLEKKIENCQQIETDLPTKLILPGDYYLLSKRLDELRLQLAILYAGDNADKIIKENFDYIEIKDFILKMLKLRIGLTLNYFDLIILLLEKIIEYPQSNKKFISVLDLLKLFINKSNNHPNQENLKYVINLEANNANKTDILTIKKMFYGIIREINKKLIFQYLLDRLIKIVVNFNNLPLTQFCNLFITKCLNDLQMDAIDFNQLIGLVYQALQRFPDPKLIIKGFRFNKLLNYKKMSEYLAEFEKDFREKIFEQIINEPVKLDLINNQPNVVIDKTLEFNISNYFPISIKNKKLQTKFIEARFEYNQTSEKKITTNDHPFFKQVNEKVLECSKTANSIIEKGKIITANTVANLGEFAETSTNRLTSLVKKNPATSSSQEHEETDQIDLNNPLTQAKEKLSSIKVKLTIWNSILNYPVKPHIYQHNQIDTSQVKITEHIAAFEASINKKYTSLNLQILNELERINTNIEKENNWFAEPEINKISLAYKIFQRGYFNIDFSREKLKAKLGDPPSFEKINNFISKQSFWSLLFTYRIIRWPWLKNNLALTWAEQLCLPDVITQIEELKEKLSNNNNEDLVEKVIVLLNAFSPYKESEAVVKILKEFKEYIVAQLNQLERLELKINDCLNEKINLAKTPGNRNLTRFFAFPDLSRSATGVSSQYQPISAQILAN